jgi:HK97 gp10 family phage protein
MAADTVQVKGLDELKRKLADVPKALRKRVLRNALAAGAREVRDVAKRNAPVLTLGTSMKAPYRKPGTVRDAIRVRTSKADRKAGDVGVFVNVRPAKAGARGAKNPNDPFYWRWLEFGTKKMPPAHSCRSPSARCPRRWAFSSSASPSGSMRLTAAGKAIP